MILQAGGLVKNQYSGAESATRADAKEISIASVALVTGETTLHFEPDPSREVRRPKKWRAGWRPQESRPGDDALLSASVPRRWDGGGLALDPANCCQAPLIEPVEVGVAGKQGSESVEPVNSTQAGRHIGTVGKVVARQVTEESKSTRRA